MTTDSVSRSRVSVRSKPLVTGHAEAERARRLIVSLTEQRDAAYQNGYSLGWLDGYEAGLRALLDEARVALGSAA